MDISFAFRKIQKSIAGFSIIAVLASLVSFTTIASAESFDDVSSSHYAADAVDAASDEGWMTGYDNGDFGVDDYLTRGQAAKILVLGALGEDAVDEDYDAGFTDVSSSYSLEDYVNTAELYGFVSGRTDADGDLTGEYDPDAYMNRAEFAKVSVEAFGLANAEAALDEFPDVDEGTWYEESSTWYVSTAWAWSVINGYDNGNFYPAYNVTRGQAALMVNRAQEPEWRADEEEEEEETASGSLMVEVSDESPEAMTIPSGATSVTLAAWDFTAGDDAELDSLTVHQYGITSLSSTHQVYLYEGSTRLTSGTSVNSTSHEATFNNLNLAIESGETRTISVRLDVGTTGSTGEVGIEIASASKVDAGDGEVEGDFPAQGEKHTLSTTAAGVVTIEKNGTVENAEVGEDGATISKFKLSTATEAGGVEELGLYLSGSVNAADVENFNLYVSGDDEEPLATVEATDDNDVIRFDLSGDWDTDSTECENSDGYCISKGGSKSFYVTADFNTGRTSDSVEIYVDQSTDVFVRGALYGSGMSVTRTAYDGNANSCNASTDADCSYFTLEGGDVTVSSNGPVAQDVAVNGRDISVLDFTIVSVTDVTFDSFEISMDTSADTTDATEGLLNGTAANFTDVKIWDNTNDEALYAGVDATAFKTATGGSTAIAEATTGDTVSSFYLFTDDFEMEAGEERELSLMTDIANTSTLDGMTFTANLELGATYPQLKDTNNKTLTNSSVLVPASAITSKTMTVRTASLALSLASTPTVGANTYVKGTQDVPFVAYAFACGDSSDCKVTNITLGGMIDDDQDNTWETSSTSANDAQDTIMLPTIVGSVALEDSEGNVIAASKGVNNTTWAVTYDSLSWTIDAGETEVVYVVGDLSSTAASENVAFNLTASNVTVEDGDGSTFSATSGGSTSAVVNNTPSTTSGTYVATVGGGSLTVAVSSSTARENIAVAGSTDVEVSAFEFITTRESFVVTDLSINNKQVGIVSTDLGEWDNNVTQLTISYENEDGDTVTSTSPLVEGTASFSGLEMFIDADTSAYLTVYADLNSISSSGSSATAGEFVDLAIAYNNFEAVAQGSGETYKGEELDASVSTDEDLDFGTITFTSGALALDGAQDVTLTLGSTLSLTVDDTANDNANKLPVGTVLCIDDGAGGTCAAEDMYIVTAWPSSTSGTEDTVTAMAIDDGGDDDYADNSVVMYSLPGTGYHTGTNRMHVFESKPTLALASSSPSGSRSVATVDDAFVFTVSADSQEKIQFRTSTVSDDDANPTDGAGVGTIDAGDITADTGNTDSTNDFIDGTAGIYWSDTGHATADNQCTLLNTAHASGAINGYEYVSFWVKSTQTDTTLNDFSVFLGVDASCTIGEGVSAEVSLNATGALFDGSAVSNNVISSTAGSWHLVTVPLTTAVDGHLYIGISLTSPGEFGQNDDVWFDAFTLHNEYMVVDMTSDTDFNMVPTATITANLKESGNTIAQGAVGWNSASQARILFTADATSFSTIEIAKGTTKTYTVSLDTGTLLDEDAGVDDPLTFSMDLGSSSDGTVTAGDVWFYETNSTVRWVGKVSSTVLSSNTVKY